MPCTRVTYISCYNGHMARSGLSHQIHFSNCLWLTYTFLWNEFREWFNWGQCRTSDKSLIIIQTENPILSYTDGKTPSIHPSSSCSDLVIGILRLINVSTHWRPTPLSLVYVSPWPSLHFISRVVSRSSFHLSIVFICEMMFFHRHCAAVTKYSTSPDIHWEQAERGVYCLPFTADVLY